MTCDYRVESLHSDEGSYSALLIHWLLCEGGSLFWPSDDLIWLLADTAWWLLTTSTGDIYWLTPYNARPVFCGNAVIGNRTSLSAIGLLTFPILAYSYCVNGNDQYWCVSLSISILFNMMTHLFGITVTYDIRIRTLHHLSNILYRDIPMYYIILSLLFYCILLIAAYLSILHSTVLLAEVLSDPDTYIIFLRYDIEAVMAAILTIRLMTRYGDWYRYLSSSSWYSVSFSIVYNALMTIPDFVCSYDTIWPSIDLTIPTVFCSVDPTQQSWPVIFGILRYSRGTADDSAYFWLMTFIRLMLWPVIHPLRHYSFRTAIIVDCLMILQW